MDFAEYKNLPGIIETDELRELFEVFLETPESIVKNQPIEAAKALLELSDRQHQTCKLLHDHTKTKVDEWVSEHWDSSSLKMTQIFLGVIKNLGLPKSLGLMQTSLTWKIPMWSFRIRKEIKQVIKEYNAYP